MWVVIVDTFSGVEARGWADRAFRATGFGDRDYLLAVAMGDREYGYVVGKGFPPSDASLARVAAAASRLLSRSPGEAVLAAARQLDSALSTRAGGGGRYPGWLVAVGLAVIAAAVLSPLLFHDIRLGLGRMMAAAAHPSRGSGAGRADRDDWTDHGASAFDWTDHGGNDIGRPDHGASHVDRPDSSSSETRGGSGRF